MAQLKIDLETGDRRREENRRQIMPHLADAGWTGIAAKIVLHAANECPIVVEDGRRWLVCRLGERGLVKVMKASKSGVHEALERLAGAGLIERGRGMFRVNWDAVCELEAVNPWVPLPPVECEPAARSEGGRSVVGHWNQEQESSSSIHPFHPTPTRVPEADRRPTAPMGIGFRIRWRDLVTPDGRVNRTGTIRVFRGAVATGWLRCDRDGYRRLLGLVLFVTDAAARREAGIQQPISWLVSALARGESNMRSWPAPETFDRAGQMIDRAGADLLVELGVSVAHLETVTS